MKNFREKLIVKIKFNLCRFLAAMRKNFQSIVNFRKIYFLLSISLISAKLSDHSLNTESKN